MFSVAAARDGLNVFIFIYFFFLRFRVELIRRVRTSTTIIYVRMNKIIIELRPPVCPGPVGFFDATHTYRIVYRQKLYSVYYYYGRYYFIFSFI